MTFIEQKYKIENRRVMSPINRLQSNIEFASTPEKPIQSILFTSALPNEGKSTIASLLAISLAKSMIKTLLIEVNVYHPTLGASLGCSSRQGWADYLRGGKSAEEIIKQTNVSNLDFIDCGKIITNHVKMIRSKAFSDLIVQYREQYQYIILDTPAMNLFIDAAVIAPSIDGTIFVIEYGKVKTSVANSALDQLARANANVIGTVLNRANTPKGLR